MEVQAECDGKIQVYNKWFPDNTTELAIELLCYVADWSVEDGGLGTEQHFRNAFHILWPNFKWHEWMDDEVHAWCVEKEFTALGHTRATKTYGLARILFLDWLASPHNTITTIATMSLERLRNTIGRDILAAIRDMSIIKEMEDKLELVSTSNEFRISLVPEEGMSKAESKELRSYSILGIAIRNMDSTSIAGRHADRRRMVGDETAGFPEEYFTAEINAASAPDFRSVHLANPNEKATKFGQSCEPEHGWESVDENVHSYRNKAGRLILHFNGLKSRNMLLWDRAEDPNDEYSHEQYKKDEWAFLIRPSYIKKIEKDSLEWYMYVLGWFPRDGLIARVWPQGLLDEVKKLTTEFDFRPAPFGLCDPAYEWDDCVLHLGNYGDMRGGEVGCQLEKTVKIPTTLEKGSLNKEFQIARRIMTECKLVEVRPENFIIDTTGNGRAVAAILEMEWGAIHRCEWGGKATERPMSKTDPIKANEKYMYFVDEMAFRLADWMKSGRLGGLSNLDRKTEQQLAPRQYNIRPGGMFRMEDKDTYKKRMGESPDYADALVMLPELMAMKGIFPDPIDLEETTDRYTNARKMAKAASDVYLGEETYCHEEQFRVYIPAA